MVRYHAILCETVICPPPFLLTYSPPPAAISTDPSTQTYIPTSYFHRPTDLRPTDLLPQTYPPPAAAPTSPFELHRLTNTRDPRDPSLAEPEVTTSPSLLSSVLYQTFLQVLTVMKSENSSSVLPAAFFVCRGYPTLR